MKAIRTCAMILTASLLLAGCASDNDDYSSQSGSSPVHLAKPGGEPGMAMKQSF